MMRLLLVRHASCAHVGRSLAGRAPGVRLDERGRLEARALSRLLSRAPIDEIVSSPLERTLETAAEIASAHGIGVRVSEAFHEIDYAAWTGRDFQELDGTPEWVRWNRARGSARVPGGESTAEVLTRARGGVDALAAAHPNGCVVVVSHCDVVRTLLAHYLAVPMDRMLGFEVGPASVSTVEIAPWGTRVVEVNRGPLPPWVASDLGSAGAER